MAEANHGRFQCVGRGFRNGTPRLSWPETQAARGHSDNALSFTEHPDAQDLSAVLTCIISLGPHNVPEMGTAARKPEVRWEPPNRAAQLQSTELGAGGLGLAFCSQQGPGARAGMSSMLSVSFAVPLARLKWVLGVLAGSVPASPCRGFL